MLSKEDMYGSLIAKEITPLSNDKLKPLTGSIYSILYRLTDEECVESYEKAIGCRSSVVYYHITDKSREKARALIKEFCECVSVIKKFMSV